LRDNVEVQVTPTVPTVTPTVPTVPGDNGTSNGLYALSALVVIPFIVVSVYVWRRSSQKTGNSAAEEASNPSPDLPPTRPSNDPVPLPDPSVACQTNAVIGPEVSPSVSVDVSQQDSTGGISQSDRHGVRPRRLSPPGIECYKLSNKDQCRTHVSENQNLPVADALPME
jgi:hypothetical protein